MIKLDAIVKAVERMTEGLNNLAKAINRAVDLYEDEKTVEESKKAREALTKIAEIEKSNNPEFGRGW